jgi:hypothetical protein
MSRSGFNIASAFGRKEEKCRCSWEFWETKEAYSFVAIKNRKSLMDRSDAGYNKGFGGAL